MKKHFVIAPLFILLFAFQSNGQNEGSFTSPKNRLNIEADFKLPTNLTNRAFRGVMDGISDVNLSLNFPLPKNIILGVGVKHGLQVANDVVINNSTEGKLQAITPFGKLGYEQFLSKRIFFGAYLKAGYSYLMFKSLQCKANDPSGKPHIENGFSYEPQLLIGMDSDDNLIIFATIAYNTIQHEFGPSDLCLNSFSGLSDKDNVGNITQLSVGFGFKTYLTRLR